MVYEESLFYHPEIKIDKYAGANFKADGQQA